MADFILAQPTRSRNMGSKTAEGAKNAAVSESLALSRASSPATPLTQRLISYSSILLVFLLAAGAFVLSYAALWETALSYGLPPRLAWIWPLLVDFALVVFSLAVVRASLYGERTLWPWLMVALYTAATVAFNILHAPDNLASRVIAVVAPISLFLSFETLMGMLKGEVKRGQQQRPNNHQPKLAAQWQTELERLSQRLEALNGQLQQKQERLAELESPLALDDDQTGLNSIQARRERVSALAGQGLSQLSIANRLGVSLSTVKRDLAALQAGLVQELAGSVPAEPQHRLNGQTRWPERSEA
jgi:hypothetical protein